MRQCKTFSFFFGGGGGGGATTHKPSSTLCEQLVRSYSLFYSSSSSHLIF